MNNQPAKEAAMTILSDEEIRAIVRGVPARPYRDEGGEPTSVRIARAVESAVIAKLAARAASLPFHIETRAGIRVLVEKSGGCHPATIYELAMWDALQQPQQCVIDHAAAIAAVTTGMKRLNDERHERTPRSGTTFGGIARDEPKEKK